MPVGVYGGEFKKKRAGSLKVLNRRQRCLLLRSKLTYYSQELQRKDGRGREAKPRGLQAILVMLDFERQCWGRL